MHKLLIFLFVLLFATQLPARVLTVSNRAGQAAQYSTIQEAVDAASAGDTIYIHGSETQYDNATIGRRLTLIGPGYNSKQADALSARVNTLTINNTENSDRSAIIGLDVFILNANNVSSAKVTRCRVVEIQKINGSDWSIENNFINNIRASESGGSPGNTLIRNNIILGFISDLFQGVVSNNVFVADNNNVVLSNVNSSIIQNNIFVDIDLAGAINSTFNNNITFQGINSQIPYGSNTGSNNQVGVNPQFMNYLGQLPTSDSDFRLRENSPGKNAGTDGTDLGVYGGAGFSESGEPPIPVIRLMTLKKGVLAPGGKLTIFLQGEARN